MLSKYLFNLPTFTGVMLAAIITGDGRALLMGVLWGFAGIVRWTLEYVEQAQERNEKWGQQ